MAVTDVLNTRLALLGGNQQGRINKGKLSSLQKSLDLSYQSQTIELEDGRIVNALLNPSKLKADYDEKILSIPYSAPILNKNNLIEEITLKTGDVFTWIEGNNSKWIIHLVHDEEVAYFRAIVKQCLYQTIINDKSYWIYVRGPVETKIPWDQKGGISWDTVNYTLSVIIKKDNNTKEYLKRFARLKIDGKNWEVQAVDSMSSEGIIELALKEDYTNTIEEEYHEELAAQPETNPAPVVTPEEPQISGDRYVYPFDVKEYTPINTAAGGKWLASNTRAKLISRDGDKATFAFNTKSYGKVDLVYRVLGQPDLKITVEVVSI